MNDIVIQFDHVGKLYHLGSVGTGTLSHDLNRWWATKILRKEDPYLIIGETNDRSTKGTSDFVWALKDITFDVHQGDVVGIIGKNGAGKSTLLKLLSRVTSPTTGVIRANGRIASLLEVGTGFHPEMTGRENIYMNGAILGMTREEITRKLDEIVEFAGVERYIDTPVKRYSSGMTVRLGFAVSAFLDPEILVVDEVLAVGDAEFQKKAIGKMGDVSQQEGRTVLFVSHNMVSVSKLCKTGIVLENGMIKKIGPVGEMIDLYKREIREDLMTGVDLNSAGRLDKDLFISDFYFVNADGLPTNELSFHDRMRFSMLIKSKQPYSVSVRVTLFDLNEVRVMAFDSSYVSESIKVEKELVVKCESDSALDIRPGIYKVNISVRQGSNLLDHVVGATRLEIKEEDFYGAGRVTWDLPICLRSHRWSVE